MFSLRDYQDALVAAIRDAFRSFRRVLMVLATGAGKTVIFVFIALSAAAKGKRVIIVAHRSEIIAQISEALDSMGVRHGRIQPGHVLTTDMVQCAMIQTLANRIDKIPAPDLVVIDESHHAISGSYQIILDRWPNARILGVTATPQRLDSRGLGRLFDTMVVGPSPSELMQAGWLASYEYLAPPSQVDLSAIHTRAGDYAVDELAEQVDKAVITGDALAHYKQHIFPRTAIAFAVRVDHAEHIAQQFIEAGIDAASVDGSMDRKTRRDRIEGIGNGRYKVLTSCALISEGLDVPSVGGVILLRPTKSLALHLQQIGRALRPKPDGSAAIILDHVGNIHRHGLPDAPRKWTLDDKKHKSSAENVTQCEVCYRVFATGPNWRAEQECPQEMPDGCALIPPEAGSGGAEAPEQVDGELVKFSVTPPWAAGLNIATAHGSDWYRLMERATTMEQLAQIAKARGYHWRWPRQVMSARARGKAA